MSFITCTRRLTFSSGHRVYNHESKCANLHGHNYTLFLTARADKLDSIGRVIDFSVLKERLGSWLETFWDHGMLLFSEDPMKSVFLTTELLCVQKLYICPFNPTAEEMAKYLLTDICPQLFEDTEITIIKIRLYETENCFADASLNELR